MTLVRSFHPTHRALSRTLQIALSFAVLGMAGCAQMGQLKSKVSDTFSGNGGASSTQNTGNGGAGSSEPLSVNAIVNTYLLHGRYTEGEQALRQYLAKYPNDRTAQGLLRQLTADPNTVLGKKSRAYVAQPGDSYSTLAARTLGDSNQFLILARYNNATDPSKLHAGDTVHLPLSPPRNAGSSSVPLAKTSAPGQSAPANATDAPTSSESSSAKAQRLQNESNALAGQGQNDQALTRLDQALTIDPHLKPAGNQALRSQLLGSYHERAVVLYRDQKLDQAIALWDHVLAIDPNYERAVIYRARAVELQSRLKQL
jgi:tetratricopeptide (TPR) repeat protein